MPILYVLIGILLGAILVPLLFIVWIVVYALLKFTLLKTAGARIVATVARLEPNKYATSLYRVILQWQQPHPEKFPIGSSVPVLIDPRDPAGLYLMEGLRDQDGFV